MRYATPGYHLRQPSASVRLESKTVGALRDPRLSSATAFGVRMESELRGLWIDAESVTDGSRGSRSAPPVWERDMIDAAGVAEPAVCQQVTQKGSTRIESASFHWQQTIVLVHPR